MRLAAASAFLLTLQCAPIAFADTFNEALAAAIAGNPELQDAQLGVRSARLDRMQARAGYLPSLDAIATYGSQDIETRTRAANGADIVNAERFDPSTASVRLTQNLYTGGRRSGQMRVAVAGVEGARASLRGTEQIILLAAAEAYLNVQSSERIVRVREEQVTALEQEYNGANRRLQVGEVSRTDLLQVQTRLAGARADLAVARSDIEIARARYEQVIGAPPLALAPAPPAPPGPADLREAIVRAEAAHPGVQESRAFVEAARGRVAIERAALLPQLSVVGSYDESEDDDFVDRRREGATAEARLSIPLFDGGYAWARTRQGRVNVERSRAQLEVARRETVSRVITVWSQLQAARAVRDIAREQVESSAQALAGAERERGLGLRSTIDVLNAEQELRSAQIALARAEAQDILAGYALLEATGELTLDGVLTGAR